MLSKKWRKLSVKENEQNSENEEEKKDEEVENKEIIIVNVDNASKSEEEEEEINNESKDEKDLKVKSIHLKTKPKPIINVDPTSIQITNYRVENKPKLNRFNNDNIDDIMNRYQNKLNEPNDYQYENNYIQLVHMHTF